MNIALVGYGKMGRQIETLIRAAGDHEIVAIACKKVGDALTLDALQGVDVAIDFSSGELMERHIELYCQAGVSAVIGTTGWDTYSQELIAKVETAGIGIVVGSNFSAGLQTFLQVVKEAARRLSEVGGYDVSVHEVHHRHKADSPSGTANTIAEALLETVSSKTVVLAGSPAGPISEETLQVTSIRRGVNAGLHEVTFDSEFDAITLTHAAHNRTGFAAGAIATTDYAFNNPGWTRYEHLFEKETV